MRRLLALLFIGLFLTTTAAFADSPKSDPHAGHQMNGMDMSNMNMDGIDGMDGMDMGGMDMGNMESGHGSGHQHETSLPETLPNYRILSVFVLVNSTFLLFGAIMKMRKQKVGVVK